MIQSPHSFTHQAVSAYSIKKTSDYLDNAQSQIRQIEDTCISFIETRLFLITNVNQELEELISKKNPNLASHFKVLNAQTKTILQAFTRNQRLQGLRENSEPEQQNKTSSKILTENSEKRCSSGRPPKQIFLQDSERPFQMVNRLDQVTSRRSLKNSDSSKSVFDNVEFGIQISERRGSLSNGPYENNTLKRSSHSQAPIQSHRSCVGHL